MLTLITILVFSVGLLPHAIAGWVSNVRWVLLAALAVGGLVHLARVARRDLLWRLRNKLVLTYLLIGLAPIVLFVTLVFLVAYVMAGQFAGHIATAHLDAQMETLGHQCQGLARHAASLLEDQHPNELELPEVRDFSAQDRVETDIQGGLFQDGQAVTVRDLSGNARTPLPWVPWMTSREPHFSGVVQDGGHLYLVSVQTARTRSGHKVTAILNIPFDRDQLERVADGVGRVGLLPDLQAKADGGKGATATALRRPIVGGTTPAASNMLDLQVHFLSTLPMRDWESGVVGAVPVSVESRPSRLYQQLFSSALFSGSSDPAQFIFLAICVLFSLLEAVALYIGLRLSRTITHSVEDLYSATVSIDRGDLQYRIAVKNNDQLADLCRSFNRMSWSLGQLIEQQKEKERMESELSIAQEVQANLFPRQSVQMPTLELHGICRPARTVSGDYYDFLTFEEDAVRADGNRNHTVTGLGIALGDISGKGISAALLMATLHSAVRAYRFAGQELLSPASLRESHGDSVECSELFASPGRILALLNRHLYRSTTPEKYATLFLAHYNAATSRLTYSNAGQLPPFILRTDGRIDRLDRGGTVVGLMDGMKYEEQSLLMDSGDILIAYSDGVTEPENDFGDFGEDRLIDTVRQFCREPLEVISMEVMRALDAWIGDGEQPDDITLVLARQV